MKNIYQAGKWVGVFLGGTLLAGLSGLQAYKAYLKNATKIKTPNGISSLEAVELGGVKQWIFIRGEDQNNPVMIFLYGGPGAPLFGMSSSRTLDAELIKHFTIIHWDQRGSGRSYDANLSADSLTFDQLVEDCNDLIDYARMRFDKQKVYIVGHSWGSVIGIKTAARYPEKIHAFVGVGQIINNADKLRVSYEFIASEAEKSGDIRAQQEIAELGPPPFDTVDEIHILNNYISHFGGVMHNSDIGMRQMVALMFGFISSPEYPMSIGINAVRLKGMNFTLKALWDEIDQLDVTDEIESIDVPIYFFEGKYDFGNPTNIVTAYFENLVDKTNMHLILFENSGHFPMIEEREKYQDILINVVLEESRENDGAK